MLCVTNSTVLRSRLHSCQQIVLQLAARQLVERAERFVHQQDRRVPGERAHDRHPLLHAAGQFVRIGVLELEQSDRIQQFLAARDALLGRIADDLERQPHVAERGAPGQQRRFLEHEAECIDATGRSSRLAAHLDACRRSAG